ncbi:MAG: 2-phospho-L-lactate guanylyltransferase [Chloroflexi bacterium]|nr:2-phospho-L-lactate guanylyltransferase [Chloroflexota bacterium]
MPPADAWAVVVARVANGAKSRLAATLDHSQRRDLALAMLADVLDVCHEARAILAGIIAVVDDATARLEAERSGALVVDDPRPGDMNAAVRLGLEHARLRGARTAIVLPGDVPLLSVQDLRALLAAAAEGPRAVVIGASRDGQGTNALLLRPVDVIAPSFGPPSLDRHARAALEAGALTRVQSNLGLALDIDTPADLAALADLPVGPHTAALLARTHFLTPAR